MLICDDSPVPSVLTAACALVLIGASAAGRVPLSVGLCVAQVALVVGWFRGAALTSRGQAAGALVAVAGAVAADIALLRARDHTDVRALAGVLAAVVGVAFVVQLARRDGRAKLVAALAATVATGALGVAGAVLLAVRGGRAGSDVVAVALAAVAAGVLPVQKQLPLWASLPIGLAVGTGVGVLLTQNIPLVGVGAGSAIAAVAVAAALAARAATGELAAAGHARLPVAVTLPVLVTAPAVLVVARIMVG